MIEKEKKNNMWRFHVATLTFPHFKAERCYIAFLIIGFHIKLNTSLIFLLSAITTE
jgi:hypothetical protein